MSSSGLVPGPFSNRVVNEYCVLANTPLSVEMLPLPSLSPPRQIADALRFIIPPDGCGSARILDEFDWLVKPPSELFANGHGRVFQLFYGLRFWERNLHDEVTIMTRPVRIF